VASNVFRFDESWTLPHASPHEVWDVLARGELLPQWWRGVYLEAEKLDPGEEPRVGARIRAKARGFLPYRLNFIIEAVELEAGRLVAVKTTGDFDGRWRAALSPVTGGTRADLTWEVAVERPVLRLLAPLLRPAFAWNHRWTTPRGEAGLRAFLAERRQNGLPVTSADC
jgi:hypothetical protein